VEVTLFLICSIDLNMDNSSGTTHNTILNFSPGIGKHFIGSALCNSDKSVIQLTVCTLSRQTMYGPLAKFVNSPYYSESELRGGAVTVSFPKYLPWQAMHLLQRSNHFLKTCCRPLITSKFLASKLPFHSWKCPEIAWGEIWIEFCVRLGKSESMEPH
jgi:hypothetical protein